ncbi:MAG: hypothetical protein V4679_16975 [Pseudomonadota bacterium]
MGIASLTFSAFSHPLHALTRWLQPAMHGGHDTAAARPRTCKATLAATPGPAWPAAARTPRDEAALAATGSRLANPAPGTDALCSHAQARRVVRVLRTATSGADTGRIVISGRMADVCAELDRMAEREALQH